MQIEIAWEPLVDGPENMRRDESLLTAGRAVGRVYTWAGPWVSLGRFQQSERVLLSELVPWVRRPTGGKAVLHGHDLTVGLAIPLRDVGLPADCRSVSSAYRALCVPLVKALNCAGISAALAEETQFRSPAGHTGDCFAHIAPQDIVDAETGVKVCGCALRVSAGMVLLQASIPVSKPLFEPNHLFVQAFSGWQARDVSGERLAEMITAQFG